MLWAAGTDRGQDLLRDDYHESLQVRTRRTIGRPAAYDAAALAAEHMRVQAAADAARARAEAEAAERAAAHVDLLATNPSSSRQQELARQAMLLAQQARQAI